MEQINTACRSQIIKILITIITLFKEKKKEFNDNGSHKARAVSTSSPVICVQHGDRIQTCLPSPQSEVEWLCGGPSTSRDELQGKAMTLILSNNVDKINTEH